MLKRILVVLLTAAMSAAPVCAEEAPPAPAEDSPPESTEEAPPAPVEEGPPASTEEVPSAPAPAPADDPWYEYPWGEEVRFSVGLGESLGIAGLVSAQIYDRDRFGDAYLVVGSTMLIINGVGVGWQHRFWDRVITPFVNGTGFAMIGLPAMCSGDHCRIKVHPALSASAGFEWRPNHFSEQSGLHLQVGLSSMFIYDFYHLEVVESPSSSPHVWPVLNVGWTRYF